MAGFGSVAVESKCVASFDAGSKVGAQRTILNGLRVMEVQ